MTRKPADRLAFALVLLVAMAGQAAAQDVARGRTLASTWCASCHQVEPGQGTSDMAPAFELVAKNPAKTDSGLRAWLRAPHPPMPNFNLAEDEIDDLIGYIGSLREK